MIIFCIFHRNIWFKVKQLQSYVINSLACVVIVDYCPVVGFVPVSQVPFYCLLAMQFNFFLLANQLVNYCFLHSFCNVYAMSPVLLNDFKW